MSPAPATFQGGLFQSAPNGNRWLLTVSIRAPAFRPERLSNILRSASASWFQSALRPFGRSDVRCPEYRSREMGFNPRSGLSAGATRHPASACVGLRLFQSALRPFGRSDRMGVAEYEIELEFQSALRPFGRSDRGTPIFEMGWIRVSIRAPAFRPERHNTRACCAQKAQFQSALRPFGRSDEQHLTDQRQLEMPGDDN